MTCNTLPAGSKRKNDGLGSAYTTRGILEQGSIAEAIQWLEKIPHYGAYNYSLVDSSDACMVEYSPKTEKVVRLEIPKDKGYLAHANHVHKLNDRNEVPGATDKNGNPIGPAFGETLARQQKADELLSGKGTTANVDYLKHVLTAAPVNNKSEDWITLQSIIVVHDPANFRIYASASNDEKRPWNEYKFK